MFSTQYPFSPTGVSTVSYVVAGTMKIAYQPSKIDPQDLIVRKKVAINLVTVMKNQILSRGPHMERYISLILG